MNTTPTLPQLALPPRESVHAPGYARYRGRKLWPHKPIDFRQLNLVWQETLPLRSSRK